MQQIRLMLSTFALLACGLASAADFRANGRLFIGQTKVAPKNVNSSLTADSMDKFDDLPIYGVEITTSLFKHDGPEWGFRYTKHFQTLEEDPESSATNYETTMDQDVVQVMLRLPFVKTNMLRADLFGGAGVANTKLKFKTSGQSGDLEKENSLVSSYGASVGVGFERVFFYVEGGFENNKVENVKSSVTPASSIEDIDLSGYFVTVGILFRGVKGTK